MLHKIKQQITRFRFTTSNRVPNRRARLYLLNYLRTIRQDTPSAYLRASMGLLRWGVMRSFHKENRIATRASCFITGRGRGTSQRFTVARTRIKHFAAQGKLFGVRKSSW